MSAILEKATGMSTAEFARTRLFEPLGIDMADIGWGTDPQGVTLGGYGIAIRPLDMAKLGMLYLYGGRWEGKQVVPAEWVEKSSRVQADTGNDKDYGYLWWVYPTHFAMEGYGEQKVMVVGDKEMVVVMTAAIDWHDEQVLEDVLRDYVIPAATSDGPLADNPAAYEALQERVAYWANPVEPVEPMSETAKRVMGKTYVIGENIWGWKEITMSFEEGSAEGTATLLQTGGQIEVKIGLDNVYRITGPMDGSWMGLKGGWVGENTFVGKQVQASPDVDEEEFTFVFEGDQVKIHGEETVFGRFSADAVGEIKE
jgi:hypothetical protein